MLRTAEATARVDGTREELFAVLADYGRYRTWLPGLDRSWVLVREGDVAVVELKAPRWSDRVYTLELIDSPPDAIVFRQIDSPDHPEVSGRWELGETEPGVGSPTTVVRLGLRLETPLVRLDSHRRMRAALLAGIDALGSRRRHLAAGGLGMAERQKVLEVVRRQGGLEVRVLGESFFLPREGPRP